MVFILLSCLAVKDMNLPWNQLGILAKLMKHAYQADQDLAVDMKFLCSVQKNIRLLATTCVTKSHCRTLYRLRFKLCSQYSNTCIAMIWLREMTKSRWFAVWMPYGCLSVNYGDYNWNQVFYMAVKENALCNWTLTINTDLSSYWVQLIFVCLISDTTMMLLDIFSQYCQLDGSIMQ